MKDRFLAMAGTARALLADFREMDQGFRDLDRQVREQIATWARGKAAHGAELELFDDLRNDRLGPRVRLEQEVRRTRSSPPPPKIATTRSVGRNA